jgi:hypothetical protein
VNLPLPNKTLIAEKILSIDKKLWFWNRYRATHMLPLMTKESISGQNGSSNYRKGEFSWLEYTPIEIKDWFEDIVFPWMKTKTRIIVLWTEPNFSNKEHIDASLQEVGTRQHKFRLVIKGRTDTLYFKTNTKDIFAPNTEKAFLMDGTWPHGMNNFTDEIKLTIAAGSPWTGFDFYNNVNLLLKKSDFILPTDLGKFL